ncbi:hypothetical protein [Streptobacillus moniliformis]|uniref:hypothetical protein n=1 Tax=Streptobacillus moniliformis TaxID=34105 RepID=UPI000AF63DD2|nr:hypothetical protein [Streptobacillus moniliformis]
MKLMQRIKRIISLLFKLIDELLVITLKISILLLLLGVATSPIWIIGFFIYQLFF